MVKSAGFLKKLKKVGNLIGKGITWANKNIVKPLNPIIDTALDFVPGGGIIKNVKNTITTGIDYLDDTFYKTKGDNRIQNYVKKGADVLLDTQRSRQDQKYLKYFEPDEDEEYAPRTYSNPFGARLN